MTRNDIDSLFELLRDINNKLEVIAAGTIPPGPAVSVEMYEIINRREVRVKQMEVLKPEAKKLLKVSYKDAAKRVAKVDGVPKWSIGDESHAVLTPAEDGMSCLVEFKADAPVGVGMVQVLADSDMTPDGVKELVGQWEYELVSGEAIFVEITAEDVA